MKAEPNRWKHLPFGSVSAITYTRIFSFLEHERLAQGLIPKAMEDKWFIYMEDMNLSFHRSWTGQAVYQVRLCQKSDGCSVQSAVCSDELIERSDAEYQAKLLDFIISNLLLGETKPFPRPAEIIEKMPGMFQHAISGTGYPETVVARTPWWKFW